MEMIFVHIAQIISPLIFISTAIAAYLAIYKNTQINKRNKRADVILHCNNRYDELYKFKLQISAADKENAKAYYARYWGLKSDQFDYWLSGWIDPDSFTNWFYSTLDAFKKNDSVGNLTFEEGWKLEGEHHSKVNPYFSHLIAKTKDIASRNKTNPLPEFLRYMTLVEQKFAREWRSKIDRNMSFKYYAWSLENRIPDDLLGLSSK